jgi:hypothetical protein
MEAMLKIIPKRNVGLWPALVRASCLLLGITILGAEATGIGTVRVEKAQVFFSKSGSSSHTLHYSNIKEDFHVKDLEEKLKMVRAAVRRKALESHFVQPPNSQKVAHRVEYRLNALLSRVSRLFQLLEPVNDLIEDFALENPKETADLTFKHRHRHRCNLVQRRKTSECAPGKEVQTDHHHDSHRDRGDRSLGSDDLHGCGVGQA